MIKRDKLGRFVSTRKATKACACKGKCTKTTKKTTKSVKSTSSKKPVKRGKKA